MLSRLPSASLVPGPPGARPNRAKNFVFVSNGDANGVCYFAGQSYSPAGVWTNPHTLGTVFVTRNNSGSPPEAIVDRAAQSGGATSNTANSWITIDLGDRRKLRLTDYTLLHSGTTNDAIRRWKMRGSNSVASNIEADIDAATWTDLDVRDPDSTMSAGSVNEYATFTANAGSSERFRWIQLLNTGLNGSSRNTLAIVELEFYGNLIY